ncbi:MAG: 2-oxo acid dehydrogenase subunit E2 [Acidobacteria bacterium]|nr:2-oxo acid dehydrogenase subunit E2 [Acidobacteriota bacterium]MCI0722051.1 2-oxo acid dehydrogenase subunit E2 [Acidobacteriota bacterium]
MIARWLKAEGQLVAQGDPLFELETDKAVAEVESPVNGTLLRIIIPEGSVRVEQIVAWVGEPGEPMDETSTAPVSGKIEEGTESTSKLPASHPSARVARLPTPAARRRARELGIVLTKITGTGPEGRITEGDVEKLHQMQIGEASTRTSPKQFRRGVLIRKLTASWQSIPHIHIARHMDAGGLISARPVAKSRFSPDVSVTDLILFVLSRVLPKFPPLMTVWKGEELIIQTSLNLALVVDTAAGVVAPVIHNICDLDIGQICSSRQELVDAARLHRLRVEQMEDGSFTLTNLGMHDVDYFAPIINSPQSAILAVGRISEEPVVVGGKVVAGWRMWANLALDHRVADGMLAARFLSELQASFDGLSQVLSQSSHPEKIQS